MFEDLEEVAGVEEEKDSLGGGGFGPVESSLQDLTIEAAFGDVSKNGAKALVIHAKNPDGVLIRQSLWVTNREGQQYTEKDGKRRYMKGYNQANAIALLTVGKELNKLKFEKKTIELYDYDEKKNVPTPVKMAVELIGKTFTAGIIKQIVDINENKGSKEKPKYEPTGYTREENEIDKIFCAKEGKNYGKTVVEVRAKSEDATFKEEWDKANTGKTRDRSKAKNGHIPKPKGNSGGSTATTTSAAADDTDPLFE